MSHRYLVVLPSDSPPALHFVAAFREFLALTVTRFFGPGTHMAALRENSRYMDLTKQ